MCSMQLLLSAISELLKKNDEIQRLQGAKFNIFKLCKTNHYENRHSDIIAELLDPAGSHGFGNLFLKAFCRIANIDFASYEKVRIYREYPIPNGRFDIFADAEDCAFVIENKIYASEGNEQLSRYSKWLKEHRTASKCKLFFLTLDGRHSSNETGVEYTSISYRREIIVWLEHCISIAAERPFVRESLRQYCNLIKDLTGENMEIQTKEEIQSKIIENKNNFRAALSITRQFENAQEKLIKNLMKKAAVDGIALNEEIDFSIADKYSGFDYTFAKECKNYVIRFEFEGSGAKSLAFGLYAKENYNVDFWKDKELKLPDGQKLAKEKTVYGGWTLEPPNVHGWIISTFMYESFRDWTSDFLLKHEEEAIKEEIENCIYFLLEVIKLNSDVL